MEPLAHQSIPFNPPPPSELPDELRNPKPRPLPDSVQQSVQGMRRRNTFFGCMIAGFLCMGFSQLGFVHTLALYILPLGYLLWFGLALCVFGALTFLAPREFRKACRYIEQGDAGFARVNALAKVPTGSYEGQVTTYGLLANVDIANPEKGAIVQRELKSRDFGRAKKDQVHSAFRVGDYVPAVWLPDQFEKTLQLYDFLEITPEHSLVYEQPPSTSLSQVVFGVLGIVGFFFVLFWNVYALGRFTPIDFDFLRQGLAPLAIGAALGLALSIAGYVSQRRATRKVAERNAEAITAGEAVEVEPRKTRVGWFLGLILIAGAMLLGAGTVLCWCFTANALFDRSVPKAELVSITDMIQVTHKLIFREYKMKYRRVNDQKDHELLTTPEHLDKFVLPFGNAQVRAGWLGWLWVDTIDPVFGKPQN